MIITLIFALALTYIIARGIHVGSANSENYAKKLMERQHKIEIVVPVKIDPLENKNILNIVDYLEEKRFREKTEHLLQELGLEVEKER
jgi:hypothetical protein